MKTILVVSYHFPPEEGSCSEKNVRIVQLLLDHGFKVIVLTKPGIKAIWENKNLKVIRTQSAGIFHRSCAAENTCQSAGSNIKSSRLKSLLSNFILPDGTIDWVLEGKKLFKSDRSIFENINLVLSISSPYSAHILSEYISKKLDVPYVMSYGDPWIYEPKRKRGFIRYNIEYALEKKLIKTSAGVLVITDWNKNKYKSLYNIPDNKIRTFHIGFNRADTHDIPKTNNSSFNIIYGGSLDPVHRDPEPFIKALRSISGINVSIYNNDSRNLPDIVKKYSVSNKVNLFPLVKASQFLNEMYKNDALLLFGNKTPFQVPGKVFTYIATGKTIIYLKNNPYPDDGTEEVLKIYGNTVILDNTENSIIEGLNKFLITKDKTPIIPNCESFEFHNTMMPIIDMINSVLDKQK